MVFLDNMLATILLDAHHTDIRLHTTVGFRTIIIPEALMHTNGMRS
jgi:hypothetical protein